MSKADAVRATTLKEGVTKPLGSFTAHIKEKYSLDVSPLMFSSYKSNFGKKKSGGRRGRPKGSVAAAGRLRATVGDEMGNGHHVISLIAEVRKLSDQYGAELVGQVAKAFEK